MKITATAFNDIITLITEAKLFLEEKQEENGEINDYLYLLNDIKEAVGIVLQIISQDNNKSLVAITEELIRNLENSLETDGSNFPWVEKNMNYWLNRVLLEVSETHYIEKEYDLALEGYTALTTASDTELQAISFHRLGQIYSLRDPLQAFAFYKESFRSNNQVAKHFVTKDHPSYHYIYEEVEEVYITTCHFCNQESSPYFCAESYLSVSYNKMYSPVKVWMHCDSCDHLFSYNNPNLLNQKKLEGTNFKIMPSKYGFFPSIGDNLKRLQQLCRGNKLLDVGIGGGELLAVAKELQFDVEGLEIVEVQARHIAKVLGINIYISDFSEYTTNKRYNLITLGDVIEHIDDPVKSIQKAYELLDSQGILWISTPNFNSAFAQFVKFEDAMWKEAGHLHYFTYHSLKMILEDNGFEIVDYDMSKHYRGSMEITAIKR